MFTLIRLFIVCGIPILVGLLTYSWLKKQFYEPVDPNSTEEVLVEVTPGSTFSSFCKKLEDLGVIRHRLVLNVLSQLKQSDTQIKAGEYQLSPAMTPQQILAKLNKGEVFKRVLTIKEGMDIWQIAQAVEDAEITTSGEFLQSIKDPQILERIGLEQETLEGYLFPETYYFSGTQTAQQVIWRVLDQFYTNWKQSYDERLKELFLTQHQVLTLASIIEKESGNVEEQGLISSVFHNRLRKGMKLQSDPTLVYGIADFGGVVLNKHKEIKSPYNTYQNFGLPPGPICSPGASAIYAALYPESSDYLFFVADGKGGHKFSKTLQEHNRAVAAYRAIIRQNSQTTVKQVETNTDSEVEDLEELFKGLNPEDIKPLDNENDSSSADQTAQQ